MGYGKHWESMYTGSMWGQPPIVFAVWGYIISHMRVDSAQVAYCEVTPRLMGPMFSTKPEDVAEALVYLSAPDPDSRHENEEGRRIVAETPVRLGPTTYRVVNGVEYRNTRDEVARRESKARSQAKWRAKKKAKMAAESPGLTFNASDFPISNNLERGKKPEGYRLVRGLCPHDVSYGMGCQACAEQVLAERQS